MTSSINAHDAVPAAIPHDGVAVAVAVAVAANNNDYHRVEAAPRRGGGFPGLRDHRLRTAFCFAAWGVAGMMSTTVPSLSANEDHVMFYYLLLMAAVLLLLLSMAASDLPWLERAAARLEAFLEDMF